MASFVILTSCFTFAVMGKHIAQIFTENSVIIDTYLTIVHLAACSLVPDMWSGYLTGIITALGM
jgi:Na+-driven multidrug efflux pump